MTSTSPASSTDVTVETGGRTSASKFAWPNSSFPHRVRSRKDGATFDTDRLKSNLQALAASIKRPVDQVTQQIKSGNPSKRFGHPDEFGATCAFLCSVQASYITGQNILIDGGAYPGTF